MKVLISGSLAYDRIMDFPGKFSDHILPEKTHMINVSFTVNTMVEKFGGTAGNIAYALKLLGLDPLIIATIGKDYGRYFDWLKQNGISTDGIKVVDEEFTAGAFITTDMSDNQITGFNPGSMKFQAGYDLSRVNPKESLGIVAPGNTGDMVEFASKYRDLSVPFIWDPGQAIPALSGDDMRKGMTGAKLIICNDYESELIAKAVGKEVKDFLEMAEAVIVTRGEQGARIITQEGSEDVEPVPPKKVLDPTGAGDAFRAGVIKGLLEGKPLKTCAMLGSTAAAYAVETYGTQEYRYTQDEFAARFKEKYGQAV